jgi:hypothetical protein
VTCVLIIGFPRNVWQKQSFSRCLKQCFLMLTKVLTSLHSKFEIPPIRKVVSLEKI